MAKTDDEQQIQQQAQPAESEAGQQESILQQWRKQTREEDDLSGGIRSLGSTLGGEFLIPIVRKHIWLIMLIVLFITISVAFRYQCQQDTLDITRLESKLDDAQKKAMTSASDLTERCRESRIMRVLATGADSLLRSSEQPPYIIYVPED